MSACLVCDEWECQYGLAMAEVGRIRAGVEAVISDRANGDFSPLLPKLRALLTADRALATPAPVQPPAPDPDETCAVHGDPANPFVTAETTGWCGRCGFLSHPTPVPPAATGRAGDSA